MALFAASERMARLNLSGLDTVGRGDYYEIN